MTPPKTSRKSHRGIQSRIENTTRLIAEFRTRELTRRDVMALFDFSDGGAGKYLNDLLAHDIIEISRLTEPGPKSPGRPVYWLTASEEKIAEYMALTSVNSGNKAQIKRATKEKSRQFHVMHDDAAFKLKLHREPAAPDPMALDRAFFRASDDSIPLIARPEPIIPPKATGFDALTVHFACRPPNPEEIKAAADQKEDRRQKKFTRELRAGCQETAEFFGQLAAAMPVIPPKPQGFPVPGQYRLEIGGQV